SVVKHGTGRKAAELGRPVAGKTGTTNDTHDAWFIGFTPDLLAGVWVGFDSERSLGAHETGGHAAAPIWTEFMKQALGDRPVVDGAGPPVPRIAARTASTPSTRARRSYPPSSAAAIRPPALSPASWVHACAMAVNPAGVTAMAPSGSR